MSCKHRKLSTLRWLTKLICSKCGTAWKHKRTKHGTVWIKEK